MSILKMSLNLKEDTIAGCLAAKYAVRVEPQMIEFAIINKMIEFLRHVFMNNKQPELNIPKVTPEMAKVQPSELQDVSGVN